MEGRLRSSRRDRCVTNGRGPGVGWAGRERPLSEGVSSLGDGGSRGGHLLPPSLFACFPLWLCLAHPFTQKTPSGDGTDNQDTLRR